MAGTSALASNDGLLLLLLICIWAFSRFYYFAFYVLHHYADPDFRYAGLWDLMKYLVSKKEG